MSEEPPKEPRKKRGPPKIGVPVSGREAVLERLRRAELRKLGVTEQTPPAQFIPVTEVSISPAVAPSPPPAVEPQAPTQEQLDQVEYERIFDELERRRAEQRGEVLPSEAEVVDRPLQPGEGEDLPEVPEEFLGVELPPFRGRRVPRIQALVRDLPAEEMETYRKFERLGSENLQQSLRALEHEDAILSGSRIDDARFAEWYARHHTHALRNIEEYYWRKLVGSAVGFGSVITALVPLAGTHTFNAFEVDHAIRHTMARWVALRRSNHYERHGLFQDALNLTDIYRAVSRKEASRQRARNERLSEGRK